MLPIEPRRTLRRPEAGIPSTQTLRSSPDTAQRHRSNAWSDNAYAYWRGRGDAGYKRQTRPTTRIREGVTSSQYWDGGRHGRRAPSLGPGAASRQRPLARGACYDRGVLYLIIYEAPRLR